MKRLFLLLCLSATVLFTACQDGGNDYSFPQKARFSITETESGVCFTVTVSDVYAEYVFTAPHTVSGLTAITKDGINYELTFNGRTMSLSDAAISVATDFTAATELLKTAGKEKSGTIAADMGEIYAKATVQNGKLTELSFVSGATKRNYKIITEVSE